jgi:hypothetical protein
VQNRALAMSKGAVSRRLISVIKFASKNRV